MSIFRSTLPRQISITRAITVVQCRSASTTPPTTSSSSSITTTTTTTAQERAILDAQRKHRPLAPHLSIYQPQLTWYGSALNRISGVTLSGLVYAYFLSYAAAPALGLHGGLDSASVAAGFAALPPAVKVAVKGAVALPFTYHSWNGLRHLAWDSGRALDLKNVYRTGYAVIAATVMTTVWLAVI